MVLSMSAVNCIQKYHSIHKSGKRLEDALSEEELKVLREYVAVFTSFPAINHARDYGSSLRNLRPHLALPQKPMATRTSKIPK
jgi:hypothetical protein